MSVAHGEQVGVLEEHGEEGGRGINWWGMIFFITSEGLIFANLIASYLYLEIRQGSWVLPNGEPLIGFNIPTLVVIFNTVILFSSSIPARIFGAAIVKGDQRRLKLGLLGTIILGSIFLGGQAFEYTHLFSLGFNPQYQIFGSAFFTLTGFHGLHVTVGLIILVIILLRALRGDFTEKKHFGVQAAEMYWHFVDGVWVFVFTTVYLLPLIRG